MKAFKLSISTGDPLAAARQVRGHRLSRPSLSRLSLFRLGLALLTTLTFSLTGCLSLTVRSHSVSKVVRAPNVLDATLEQLNQALAAQYAAVQTINASVTIKATTGGEHQGEVKELPSFSGYILLRKPADLRTMMLLPLVRSLAMDMVSDGKTFKLSIPPKSRAVTGLDHEVAKSSKNGLDNLRPYIIRDALLIPPVPPEELVSSTQDFRILAPAPGRKEATEEPDYDLTVSKLQSGNVLETIRVIHISRATLKPYRQDIYDHAGQLVTVVTYDKYQKFGDIDFPMSILIRRPLDEFSLQIDLTKLTLNEQLDDEQFLLKFPPGVPVTKM